MSVIPGVRVTDAIVPTDSADVYGTHYARYGVGGWRTVADITERNAISSERREEGMVCYVVGDKAYVLEGGITNSDWTEFSAGGDIPRLVTRTVGPAGTNADYTVDGVEDDVQIRAAAEEVFALGGGTVYIMAGSYHMKTYLPIPSGVKYQGAGMYLTRLIADANMTDNRAIFSDFSHTEEDLGLFTEICHMELDGSAMAKPGYREGYIIGRKGLEGEYWKYHYSHNLWIHDMPATGWGLDYLSRSLMDHNIIKSCGTKGAMSTVTLSSPSNLNVSDGDTVVIGRSPANTRVFFSTTNPTDGETVTIAGQVYTFRDNLTTVPSTVPFEVKIDPNPGTTSRNLRVAIRAYDEFGNQEGNYYSEGTTENMSVVCPNASITNETGSQFDLYGRTTDVSEEAITVSSTSPQVTFSSPNLANSLRRTYTFRTTPSTAFDVLIGASADASLTNLQQALSLTGVEGTTYGTGTTFNSQVYADDVNAIDHSILINSRVIGDPNTSYGNAIATTTTATNLSFSDIIMSGGNRAVTQGSNGYGVGVNGMAEESWIISNSITEDTAHDGYMLEDLKNANGSGTMYLITGCISLYDRFGIDSSGQDNYTITNNQIYGALDDGIILFNFAHKFPSNLVISNNLVRDCGGYGIKVDNLDASALTLQTDIVTTATITGNVIEGMGKSGIFFRGDNYIIANNNVRNCGEQGIYSTGMSAVSLSYNNITITGNHISNTGLDGLTTYGYGIKLDGSFNDFNNVTVTNNRCWDDQTVKTQKYGVGLIGGNMTNVMLLNNNLTGNLTDGLRITSTVTGITRRDNFGISDDYNLSAVAESITGVVPFNKTVGDLTATRLMLGDNTAFNGVSADIVAESTSTAGGGKANIYSHLVVNPASTSTTEFRGIEGVVEHKSGNTSTLGTVVGVYGNNIIYGNGAITASISGGRFIGVTVPSTSTLDGNTIANARALEATGFKISGTPPSAATITNVKGITILDNDAPSPITITNSFGADISAMTRATGLNVGLRIAAPSGATNNFALQLSDTGGTASGGIMFGSTGSANLYRSASSTLKTDGDLIVAGTLSYDVSVVPKAASYTTTDADDVINVTTNGPVITLHDATIAIAKPLTIKNSSAGNISFATTSSQTVDGSTTGTIVPNQSLTVITNGSNWIII